MGSTVAGVDGCRGGWVVATDAGLVVVPAFADVLAMDVEVIAIDIPIGLVDVGRRMCDVEARRVLGAPRCSSVFSPPVRSSLSVPTWAEAVGMSKQMFHLLPKMREVDAAMTPALQARVVEVHPEVSFAGLAGTPMTWPKKKLPGRAERMAALGLSSVPRVPGAAADDVLDALAALWSARRIASACERRLGDGATDSRGLRMEIVV